MGRPAKIPALTCWRVAAIVAMPPPADVAIELDALKRAVLRHHAVSTRFGVFALRRLHAYESLNPMTGEPIPVPARTVIDFAPSPAFLADLGAVDVAPPRDVTFRVSAVDAQSGVTLETREVRVTADDPPKPVDTSAAAPVMTIACDALYEHLRKQCTTARSAKYSGFGNFVLSRHRPPRFEFAASQVWKQEVRDAVQGND